MTFVERTDGSSVRVPSDDVQDLPIGATIEVVVGSVLADGTVGDQGPQAVHEVLEASLVAPPSPTPAVAGAGSAVTNSVTVVRVVPAGGQADSMSVASLTSAVNGPVADFWRAQTDGRIQLGVVASPAGWVTSSASCADPVGLWNSAAAAAGWTPGANKHLLVYVSSLPQDLGGCSFGLAEQGTSATSGGRLSVRSAGTSVIAHELGHNFGLAHSSQVQCDGTVETGTCQVSPYRDFYDVMGASWNHLGSLNAAQADRLGVLSPTSTVGLTASDRGAFVELQPRGAGSGVRALRLTSSTGAVYWVELRSAVGQDWWLGSSSANVMGLSSGLVVHRPSSGDDTSLLLDATPSPRLGWDTDRQSAVPFGDAVSLADGDFVISAHATPAGTAVVLIDTPTGAPSSLSAGQALVGGRALESDDGRFRATLQSDGNLVVYGSGERVLWANYRWAPGSRLVMQPDGNLVAYGPSGAVTWHAGTWNNPGAVTRLGDDGALSVVALDGRVLWSSGSDAAMRLGVGQQLTAGQALVSSGGRVRATLQSDGNLVVYGSGERVLWANYRWAPGSRLVMQPDGNLVAYGPSGAVTWHAGTWNNPGAVAELRDDGTLAVISTAGRLLWSTPAAG